MPIVSLRRILALCLVIFVGSGVAAAAQGPPSDPPAAVVVPIISAETKAVRAKLDAFKLDLDQKEAALQRRDLGDGDLQRLRQELDPTTEGIRAVIDGLAPKLDATKARLDQLGPKPKEEAPEESSDVARERSEREGGVAEIDETQRLARALLVQAEQLTTQVSDRRRAGFTRALFQRTSGILSPDLWMSVARALPRDARALRIVLRDWLDRTDRNSTPGVLLLLGLAIGVAVALYIGRRHLAPRFVARDPSVVDPPRRNRLTAALGVLLIGSLPAAAGSYMVYAALDLTEIVPPRLQPVVGAILAGIAFVAFVHALAEAVLASGHGPWRLIALNDVAATRTSTFLVSNAAVVAFGKVLETLNQAIAAALPITVATRGLFTLIAGLILAELLRRFATAAATDDEDCLGPYVPSEPEVGGPVRMIGWAAVGVVIASALLGYVAFASFLVDQIIWIAIILALLLLAISVGDEFVGGTLLGHSRLSTTLQANTGLRRRSLEQIGVLVNGIARVALIVMAVMLALAPWGVDSADLLSSLRAAFFGFKVGDVTISLSTVAFALALFALGVAMTRIVQRWLDTTFLPRTDLDAGLRNSISTALGYLGVFGAVAIAFSYLGLSLDKIALVAGALSVGIGFGLQSIVNNFVSGLILLWERPIRVGDLVVVGDGEGHVRKISVRATEIETFDRATIIVPNSNLISGVVKNRVRGDRTGRVIITVNVLRNQDPARAAVLLTGCARAHADVLKEPEPRVVFKKIGDTWLEFELICFVGDVNLQQSVQSDLNFAIFQSLNDESVMPPLGPPSLQVQGLGSVETALEHIASALAADRRASTQDHAPVEAPQSRLGPRVASER
jgi:potassium efflux system protein